MNNKRYWLRGGVSAVVLGILLVGCLYLITMSHPQMCEDDKCLVFVVFPGIIFGWLGFLAVILGRIILHLPGLNIFSIVLLDIIGTFFAGSMVGIIYGKIKNRNNTPQM